MTKKSNPKPKPKEPKNKEDLENKLQELSQLLEKERAEKELLAAKLNQKNWLSLDVVRGLLSRFKRRIPLGTEGRREAEAERLPEQIKSALEESVSDDLATYQGKLKKYSLVQLEDIFLNIDREAHPDRFNILVEELKKRSS